jgi:hypothetical protein
MIDVILDYSMPLFILHLTLKLLPPLGANIVTCHGVSQALITGYEVWRSTILPVARAKKERGGKSGVVGCSFSAMKAFFSVL